MNNGASPKIAQHASIMKQLPIVLRMTRLGNTQKMRCRLLVNMTNVIKLLYYQGNIKT
jgi:hypothetical protein